MNHEISKYWTSALRSEKYVQGAHYLKRARYVDEDFDSAMETICHCALGVLCELAPREIRRETNDEDYPGMFSFHGRLSSIPDDICKWASLSIPGSRDIISLNDIQGKTFKDIADFIDANWEKL